MKTFALNIVISMLAIFLTMGCKSMGGCGDGGGGGGGKKGQGGGGRCADCGRPNEDEEAVAANPAVAVQDALANGALNPNQAGFNQIIGANGVPGGVPGGIVPGIAGSGLDPSVQNPGVDGGAPALDVPITGTVAVNPNPSSTSTEQPKLQDPKTGSGETGRSPVVVRRDPASPETHDESNGKSDLKEEVEEKKD